MNREMLLESNNIDFEPKLQNIGEMASKLINSGQEPLVDDVSNDGINNMNTSIANHNEETEGSWKDVMQIFETTNKPKNASKTTNYKVQQSHNQNKHSKGIDSQKAVKKIDTIETVQDVDYRKTNANKENIDATISPNILVSSSSQYPLQSSYCSIQGKSNIDTETIQSQNGAAPPTRQSVSLTSFPSSTNDSKPVSSINDHPNRVRQVNVEMFTVTLKRNDPLTDEFANENN